MRGERCTRLWPWKRRKAKDGLHRDVDLGLLVETALIGAGGCARMRELLRMHCGGVIGRCDYQISLGNMRKDKLMRELVEVPDGCAWNILQGRNGD